MRHAFGPHGSECCDPERRDGGPGLTADHRPWQSAQIAALKIEGVMSLSSVLRP
jgi:hypothetical protein